MIQYRQKTVAWKKFNLVDKGDTAMETRVFEINWEVKNGR